MALSNGVYEQISFIVIKTLIGRFESFPENANGIRNAPFHKAFLQAFSNRLSSNHTDAATLISLSSWLHGLNTTLGQSFFEKTAHVLSNGTKRKFVNRSISSKQKNLISEIATDLKNGIKTPDVRQENKMIRDSMGLNDTHAVNFTADVFIEELDRVIAIEIKSVKPNSGELRGEKQKILEGKAVLMNEFPDKEVCYFIGFPFDPTVDNQKFDECAYDTHRFLKNIVDGDKYFDEDETLIASQLWDFLSEENNTMATILEIINKISTVDFQTKFDKIRSPQVCTRDEYLHQLKDWYLFSEMTLFEKDDLIKHYITGQNRLVRAYNSPCFNEKGEYNSNRFNLLRQFVASS